MRTLLNGKTSAAPAQTASAIMLTMMFEPTPKYDKVDPELSWLNTFTTDQLPLTLGAATNHAMRFPEKAVRLTQLAEFVAVKCTFVKDPKKLDLWRLAILPCARARFPNGHIDEITRPYSSHFAIAEVLEVFVSFFELLGCEDDNGRASAPPLSPRSLLNICSTFARDFYTRDPPVVMIAVEAVVYGVISEWFKHQFEPARAGRDAKVKVSKYLVPQADVNLQALFDLRKQFERRLARDAEDSISLAEFPAAEGLPSYSELKR